jgi:hypothetical protein
VERVLKRRGFTMLEAMLGSTLGLLLLTLLVLALIPLLRYSAWHSARSTLLQSATVIAERLGADLQRAPLSGIVLPGRKGVLSIHPVAAVTDTGLAVWDTSLLLYAWSKDAGSLTRATWKPERTNMSLGPFSPPEAEMVAALAAAPARQQLVAGVLTDFALTRNGTAGTPLRLRVVTELNVPARGTERFELTREFALRSEGQ